MSAGVDSQGHIVVVAGFNLQISYIVETNTSNSRWSTPTHSLVKAYAKIERIIMKEITGNLYISVALKNKDANTYSVFLGVWLNKVSNFRRILIARAVRNPYGVFLGIHNQDVALYISDRRVVGCVDSHYQEFTYVIDNPSALRSACATTNSSADTQIFAILEDGNVYHLVTSQINNYRWMQLSQGMNFRQILVEVDGSSNVHIFAVSNNNKLYHLEQVATSSTDYTDPAPIHKDVMLLGGVSNDRGDINLFAIGTAQSSLTHLFQEEASGNWVAQAVEVPTTDHVEEYISYTSDVTVYDNAGAPLVNSPVSICASEETRVTVNGETYFVDPHRPAQTSTNSAGILSIAQETGSLAIPSLQINFTSVMLPGQSIAIRQSADVQNRLATVGGIDLMNAKDVDGSYLLADEYRNETTTNSLANAFNQCMKLPGSPSSQATPNLLTRQGSKPGVWLQPSGSVADLRLIATPYAEQHWRLSFEGSKATYQPLTQEEAGALLAEKRASLLEARGFVNWLGDIGDLVEGVAQGIINVGDVVVHTVSEGIKAAFTITVHGIKYLFDAVVTSIEQAFDIVETIFAQVKVTFKKVFEWLGFLFDWPDILRTHEALVYTINQFLGFLQGSVQGIQGIVDTGISTLQKQVSTWFDTFVEGIGEQSLGGYEKDNKTPPPQHQQFNSALSNNIVYNGFINNARKATSSSSWMLVADSDPLKEFMDQLKQFANNIQGKEAFTEAITYFQNLGSSPDQFFSQSLKALLRVVQGVVQIALSGVQAIVDTMLQLIQKLVAALRDSLNETWNIPFVSPFYRSIADGAELTPLDLIALIVAIPTTIFYKILNGTSPFPTEDSVTSFKKTFNTQSMLRAVGFPGAPEVIRSELVLSEEQLLLPKEVRILFAVAGCICSAHCGLLSSALDLVPPPAKPLKMFSVAILVLEAGALCFSVPWFYEQKPEVSTITLWICFGAGFLLDCAFVVLDEAVTEYTGGWGPVVAEAYGVIHLGIAIWSSIEQKDTKSIPGIIMPVIPELLKILRLEAIVTATEGISLAVLAGCDAIFIPSGAVMALLIFLQDQG